MKSNRKLIVKANSLKTSLKRFKEFWEKAERGEAGNTPVEILSFENSAVLVKVLSPKRLALLQQLHEAGKVSIRQLAKILERDYRNVHQDVKSLCKVGLILEDKSGKFYAPWNSIVTEIPLCTNSTAKHCHSHHRYLSQDTAHG